MPNEHLKSVAEPSANLRAAAARCILEKPHTRLLARCAVQLKLPAPVIGTIGPPAAHGLDGD
jgi:hypothetical protein